MVSFLLRSGKQSAVEAGLGPVSLAKWNNLQDLEFLTNYSGLKCYEKRQCTKYKQCVSKLG